MRYRRTDRSATLATPLFVVLISVAVTAVVSADEPWHWPIDDLSGAQTPGDTVTPWVVIDSTPGERRFRPVSDGEIVFRAAAAGSGQNVGAVPQSKSELVVRHRDGLWSRYRADAISIPDSARTAAGRLDGNARIAYQGELRLAIHDLRTRQLVNPRAVLPENPTLPADEMPVPGFRQGGRPVRGRDLLAGDALLVVPEEWLRPITFPRRMYVLIDGLLAADISFVVPARLQERVLSTGDLLILEHRFSPGPATVEIESHQFDGTVQNRTIRLFIPSPPATPAPLDTP